MNETILVTRDLMLHSLAECDRDVDPIVWNQVRPWFDEALQSKGDEIQVKRSLILALLQVRMIHSSKDKTPAPYVEQLRALYLAPTKDDSGKYQYGDLVKFLEQLPPPGPSIRSSFVIDNKLYAQVVEGAIWMCAHLGRLGLGQVGYKVIWLANTVTVKHAGWRTGMMSGWNSDLVPLSREWCDWLLGS